MASQKEKLIAEALKLVEKGQYERAVKVYLKVVAEDDKDVRIWLKVGDLYTKLRRNAEAAETYQHVAQAYSEQGFYTKAIAVYKQILKLDPSLVNVHERLADLYRQMGLIPDAIDQYSQVAAYHGKEGNAKAALASLKQIVELDPQNVATRVKLAELYSREQMVREAIDEFAKAAEHLHEQGRHEDYMKVAERLLFHSPDNRPVSRELARLYLERNDARKALPRLQVCFKADPRDGETLSLLAEAFRALGQTVKAVSVLKELARIQAEIGATLEREDTFRRVLELDPHDAEARAAVPHGLDEAAPAAHAPPSRPPSPVTHGAAPRRATERPTIVNPPGSGVAAPAGAAPPPPPRRTVERPTVPAPRVIPVAPPAAVAPPTAPSLPPSSMTSAASIPAMPAVRPPSSPSLPPAAPTPPAGTPLAAASPVQSGGYSRLAPTVEVTGDAADALSRPAPRPAISRSDLSPSAVLLPMGSMAPLPPSASSPVSLAPSLSRAPVPPSAPSSDNLEPPPVTEEELRKILAETDVFAKYNLHAKAIEHIRTVFDRDPTHVAAREKLKGLLMAVGRKADALEELRTLAHQAEGLASESGYLDEMLEIDPSDVWARRRREVLLVSPPPVSALSAGQGGGGLPEHVDVDLSDVETSAGPGAPATPPPATPPRQPMAARGPATPRPVSKPPSNPARRPLEVQATGDDFAVVVDEGPASRPPPAAEPIEDRFGEDLDAAAGLPSLAASPSGGDYERLDLSTPPPPSLPTAILANGLDSVRPIGGHQPPTPNRAITTTTGRADLGRLRGARREVVTAPAVVVPPAVPLTPRPSPPPRGATQTSPRLGPASSSIVTSPDSSPLAGGPDLELHDEATPITPPSLAEQATAEPPSLTDELRDIDFYLSQGIVHEARAALEALMASHPGHPALLARLASLPAVSSGPAPAPSPTPTLAGSPAPFAPTPPPGRPEAAKVALAAAGESDLRLEGEATQSVRMDELLAGEREASRLGSRGLTDEDISAVSLMPTRRNVVEVGVSADDFATHFELGIGYKGMGLLDDAIVEFKLAAKDPAREVQCHQMIGLCYLDKGRAHDAVRHFKQGLYAERILEDEELSLYYELGLVYERIGDRTESLYYFERIRKRKPRYRDVERRIETLLPPNAAAPTPPPAAIQGK